MHAIFEVFMAVKIEFMVSLVIASCDVVVGIQPPTT
jgi:hypothetical protein